MRSKLVTFVVVLLVLLAGFLFLPEKFSRPVKNGVQTVAQPFELFASKVGQKIQRFFGVFSEIANLRSENADLHDQVFTLMQENLALKEVKNENEILKKEIEVRGPDTSIKLLKADIIGREPSSFLQSFTINQGESSGVKVNQAVVYQGVLVGKIFEVSKNSAKITLVVSSHSTVQGELQDSRTLGIVKGGLQGLYIDKIPQEVSFKSGEQVITSGLGEDLPKGIIIGKVDKVTTPKSEIFQTFSITTPLDFFRLESVFVRIN